MRTLRLHVNQVLVEVLELFHGGPEGHNLAGGVHRGEHLCSRHPAASPDVTWEENKNINIFRNWYLIVKVTENRSDKNWMDHVVTMWRKINNVYSSQNDTRILGQMPILIWGSTKSLYRYIGWYSQYIEYLLYIYITYNLTHICSQWSLKCGC